MRTRYDAALDGIPLSGMDESICVTDIAYGAPMVTRQGATLAGRDGQIMLERRTESVSVEISFEIRERNVTRRMQIAQDVQRWAMAGGYLTTSDRAEQRLLVVCETPPVISSSLRWNQALRIGFAAYAVPYWQDAWPVALTITGNGSADVFAPGMAAPCMVEGEITNTGTGTITTADIVCGDTAWHLTGLALGAGKSLVWGFDKQHILFIHCDGESALARRTAASSDELALVPGDVRHVSVETNTGAHTAKIEIRGMWL